MDKIASALIQIARERRWAELEYNKSRRAGKFDEYYFGIIWGRETAVKEFIGRKQTKELFQLVAQEDRLIKKRGCITGILYMDRVQQKVKGWLEGA